MASEIPVPLSVEAQAIAAGVSHTTIAGFWRRVGASLIDWILLGVFGSLLGLVFFNTFAEMGPKARLIGFTVALLYFGILNSVIGGGKTLGKRVVHIRVVDCDGECISLPRSALRYVVLALPWIFGRAIFPVSFILSTGGILLCTVLAGITGTSLYLLIFNRRTRQLVHDLVTQTYVVQDRSTGQVNAPPTWGGHWVFIGLVLLFVVILTTVIVPRVPDMVGIPELLPLQEKIIKSGKVHHVVVMHVKTRGQWRDVHSMSVIGRWKKRPRDYEWAAQQLAAIVLIEYPGIAQIDTLAVTIVYGYDIGIARRSVSHSFAFPPDQWREILELPGTE